MYYRTALLSLSLIAGFAAPAAAAEQNCALTRILQVDLNEQPNGLYTVPMILNGRASQVVFDTGGGARALTPEVLTELGLEAKLTNLVTPRRGDRNVPQAMLVQVTGAEFAGAKLPENSMFSVMPAPEAAIAALAGPPRVSPGPRTYEGVINAEMFSAGADVELDFAGKHFTLFANTHCKGQVVYWPAAAIAQVPFRMENTRITFDAVLDDKPIRAVLDTGAAINTIDLEHAKAAYMVDVNAADVVKKTDLVPGQEVYEKRFASLGLDVLTIRNPLMVMAPSTPPVAPPANARGPAAKPPEPPRMVLGTAMLKRFHIFIAFKEQMLYITPAAAPAKPAAAAPPAAGQ